MIVMLLTSQNEADMLRLNLEHHLNWGIDHIAVADNQSVDDTQDVVNAFGDQVSSVVFDNFHDRQLVRMEMLERIRARHTVDWVGVSDTDELVYSGETDMQGLLADTPDDIVAVNFEGKLYLPTALDSLSGPMIVRRKYRTGRQDIRLHTSYKEGKTFYRSSWLQMIDHEHHCLTVPHPVYRHAIPAVHHYMVRDEDQFVAKVSRLIAWSKEPPPAKKLLRRQQAPRLPGWSSWFKKEWWNVYVEGGEPAVRDYYRTRYTIAADEVERLLAAHDLVFDDELARYWERLHPATGVE